MNKKKKIPLKILKSLESFVKLAGDKFNVIDPNEHLLSIIDTDEESEFYFRIEKYEKKHNGSFQLLMDRRPTNEDEVINNSAWIGINDLPSEFKKWLNLLDAYNSIESFYDDPIIKSNAERFQQQFELLDEFADRESFDLDQQLFLEEYLDQSSKKLEKLKQGQTKEKIQEIELLENETDEIKSALTKESKKKILNRLTKFWARAQKTGLDVIKEVLVNVATELTKKLMIGE
ncbi:MAG: hypothetical protein RJQ09_18875 [Cyclobacteriaceae bacterium]